eukprot:Nk52_evm77s270 gene=Nk52_evmTU77s270
MDDFFCGCDMEAKASKSFFKMMPSSNKRSFDIPTPQKTDYIEDVSASIAINTRNAKKEGILGHYSLLVETRKEIPSGAVLDVAFENPESKFEPIVVRGVEVKNDNENYNGRRFYFISPALRNFECGQYTYSLTVKSPEGNILGTHTNAILSRVNTSSCPIEEFTRKMNAMSGKSDWKQS